MSGIDISIGNLKNDFESLKLRLIEYRKKGLDTKIAELKLMNIPSKIELVKATQSYKDVENVTRTLNSVNEELNEIEQENKKNQDSQNHLKNEMKNFRTSLEKKESSDDKKADPDAEMTERTEKLIKDANDCLNSRNYNKALQIYSEITGIYKQLPKELKKAVYGQVIDIHKKLIKSGAIKINEKK